MIKGGGELGTLAIIVIMICVGLLASSVLKNIIHPETLKMKNKYEEGKKIGKEREKTMGEYIRELSSKMPLVDLPEDDRIILQQKINRLGLDTTVEEVRKLQLFYLLILLVVGIVVFLTINKVIGIIIMLTSAIVYKNPIRKIDNEIQLRNEVIRRELPELYTVLYYSFRRDINVNISSKIQSYIKNCDELFYKEMQLFLDDARSGEREALRQFKKRVPIDIVLRFCDIMENRLEGYDNVAVMTNFKLEMDAKKSDKVNLLLRDLENSLYTINNVGVTLSLTIIVLTFLGAMLYNTFT